MRVELQRIRCQAAHVELRKQPLHRPLSVRPALGPCYSSTGYGDEGLVHGVCLPWGYPHWRPQFPSHILTGRKRELDTGRQAARV